MALSESHSCCTAEGLPPCSAETACYLVESAVYESADSGHCTGAPSLREVKEGECTVHTGKRW